MALFKKKGDSLSRAGAILDALAPKEGDEGVKTPDTPPVEGQQEPNTPPTDEPTPPATPPVEGQDTPPVEGAATPPAGDTGEEGEEGTATPPTQTTPTTPPVDTPPTAPEITDELLYNRLSEMLGREVKSADDLKALEAPEVDPEVKQLLEWKEKTGLSLSEWSKFNKDFSQMGDLDVAREILAQKYPNFTKEELDYSLRNFVYDETVDDEGAKIKKSIELKKFAQEGREQLESKRLELVANKPQATLTKEQQDAIALAQQVQANQATVQQQQEAYNQGITKASQGLDSIDLKLSDDLTLKYNVPVEVKKSLPKTVAEMPHWYNEDGSYNHANVVKDVAKVTNFEAIVKAAYEQGIAVGKEGQIKKGANITIDGTPPSSPQAPTKGNVAEVIGKLAGDRNKSRLRFRNKK